MPAYKKPPKRTKCLDWHRGNARTLLKLNKQCSQTIQFQRLSQSWSLWTTIHSPLDLSQPQAEHSKALLNAQNTTAPRAPRTTLWSTKPGTISSQTELILFNPQSQNFLLLEHLLGQSKQIVWKFCKIRILQTNPKKSDNYPNTVSYLGSSQPKRKSK